LKFLEVRHKKHFNEFGVRSTVVYRKYRRLVIFPGPVEQEP